MLPESLGLQPVKLGHGFITCSRGTAKLCISSSISLLISIAMLQHSGSDSAEQM